MNPMETHMAKSKKQAGKSEAKKASKKAKKVDTVFSIMPTVEAEPSAVEPVDERPSVQSVATPKAPREERNGVKRPKGGGKCAAVWTYLDANPTSTAKEIREVAAAKGWNINNAQIELSQWRKFMGIAKPAAK